MEQKQSTNRGGVEWPTLVLITVCYVAWGAVLWVLPLTMGVVFGGVVIALHASLQHEVIHGHPFRRQWLNDLLIWPPLTLIVPYSRFKVTHLAHHHDEVLTDPYDDPESNFLDEGVWEKLPVLVQGILRFNNTVAGRLTIGPLIGTISFLLCEWRSRDRQVLQDWAWHLPAVGGVLWLVSVSPMPIWAYCASAYLAMSILKLRTYLEHQASDRASGRSVIVERGGIFGFLFLNNNLHVVHHMHPKVAWYDLPRLYRSRKDHYLRRNGGYFYASYGDVFRRYFLRAKDPVAHPLWRR
ncbi:fatty acid desaturase [Yoonia litorea]|uniref:Fatty acid desaturase n=1 Tax=Yoonia litorea TaxID=1123755 RepID=A0A1I6LG17_9RHOB|nr:fatty acid desaturase [Yoonia litorea]SFS02373.1 Fatty acid desaturase [Yoonia litorea]